MSQDVIFKEPRVQKTSIQALKNKIRNGTTITDKERCQLIIAEYGPITAEQMELHMGKTQSKFTGRIRKLKDEEKIQVAGYTDNSDGNRVQLLEVTQK